VSSAREIAALEAEVTYYRDSVALMRARLYGRGQGTSPRFEELQRRLDIAQQSLRAARAEPTSPQQGPRRPEDATDVSTPSTA
jgi:hypothetical protein